MRKIKKNLKNGDRRYSDILKCGLLKVSIDYMTDNMDVYLPKHHCCGGGVIEFCKNLLPDVKTIQVWSGEVRDTEFKYSYDSDDWYCSYEGGK